MSLFFFDATKVLVNGWFSHEDFGDEEEEEDDDDGTLYRGFAFLKSKCCGLGFLNNFRFPMRFD
jgi:hypothetical protein